MTTGPRPGIDGGVGLLPSAMVRWILLGSIFFGLGLGVRNGWVEIHWEKMAQDLNVPFLTDPEPLDSFTKSRQSR